jgi:hypothetical protein
MPNNQGLTPEEQRLENEITKLKMMAEMGARFDTTMDNLPPDIEKKFLDQVYAFEKNFAAGQSGSFAETAGRPSLPAPHALANLDTAAQEKLVAQALAFYQSKNIEVHFKFDYSPATRYRFLVEELPEKPNFFGCVPGMVVGVLYEEYHPNHAGELETITKDFMQALQALDIEQLQYNFAPVQALPEGPYPTAVLLKALGEKFLEIDQLADFQYTLLETSYEINEQDAPDEAQGMGYTEGLIEFEVHKKTGERRPINGPFKFYFQYENGFWSIMYMVFPGIKYPPVQFDNPE